MRSSSFQTRRRRRPIAYPKNPRAGVSGSLVLLFVPILGADEVTTFRKVTVPQLWPGILSGALLAFTMSFDDFVITSFVSGSGSSTLPIVVDGMVRKNVEPSINAISTIILLVTTGLIYLADRLGRDR